MEMTTYRLEGAAGWPADFGRLDSPNTVVLVFADSSVDPAALGAIAEAFPQSCVTGCSTAGEILGETLSDHTLTVMVAQFESTTVRLAAEPIHDASDSFSAGTRLATRLFDEPIVDDGLKRLVFVLSEGLGVSGSLLVDGLAAVLGREVAISGGLAGDGPRFEQTWVLVDGRPQRGYVVGIALSGPDLRASFGSRGGWEIFGPERRVTRSCGALLHEVDGRPALELYKDYLGARAAELPASALLFPLAIRVPGREPVVRTILAVDDAAQTMTFAGDIPEGSHAQLMRANSERLIEGAYDAAISARKLDATGAVLAIAVSCVGRRLLLGRRTEDELEAVMAALGPDVSLVGFYSYGEISPGQHGSAELHNQTMTLTTITEHCRSAETV